MSEAQAPAGFWRRYAAWSLDWALLGALLAVLVVPMLARAWGQLLALNQLLQDWLFERMVESTTGFPSPGALAFQVLADPALADAARAGSAQLLGSLLRVALLASLSSTLYFVLSEGGPWQGTPGKRALGLRVRAADGGVAGFGRAWLRHLAGAISWGLLNLGHAIAAWRRDRRALHDLIAGTQVLAEGPMPRWARAWLGLQLAVVLGALLAALSWFAWQVYQLATL